MAKASVSIYKSTSLNPFINLSIENFLFVNHVKQAQQANHQILYLWRNGPSVIIGRNQSAHKECNRMNMEQNNVYLVRRASGGGAVYQDKGNSIFSFISPKLDDTQRQILENNEIIIKALAMHGIKDAKASGRNDLILHDRKISGAAFKHTKDTSLHHGTLLLDVDMTALSRYLTPNKAKLQSKGVASVESRVMNLKEVAPEINHENISVSLIQSFLETYNQQAEIIEFDDSIVGKEPLIRSKVEELQDWEWRYGSEPKFTHNLETRMPWATLDVNLVVNKSIIEDTIIYTDALDVKMIESIRNALKGCLYTSRDVQARLASSSIRDDLSEHSRENLDEFSMWLSKNL
jgi:lipoate---protein ligase